MIARRTIKKLAMSKAVVWVLALLLAPLPAAALQAEPGWLDRANRLVFAFNRLAVETPLLRAEVGSRPLANWPAEWRDAAANLTQTWIAAPWQAATLAAAGRPGDARIVLERVRVNIMQGQGGILDRAREIGMPQAPRADLGLALCAHGVPEGPYVVLPVLGGRTLRDGAAELALAYALAHAAVPGAEWLDISPIWALAERMGRPPGLDPRAMDFDTARESHITARRRACETLRAPR